MNCETFIISYFNLKITGNNGIKIVITVLKGGNIYVTPKCDIRKSMSLLPIKYPYPYIDMY